VMLSGEWQADNAALAYRMFAQLHEAELGKVASSVGTRRAFIAGRLEERSWQHGTVLLDGAHNVPAVECLLRHLTLTRPPGAAKWIGVVGISCTKDWRQMLDRVAAANIFEAVVVTRATRPRGVDPAELSEYISGIACVPIISHPSLRSTLVWARARAHRKLLIFGSLLLLADFDRALHAIGCGRDAAPIEELDPEQPWMLPLC
jgi:folylpolyglutamate synthase/dihydropteroate synthase